MQATPDVNGWIISKSKSTGKFYFFNTKTSQSVYERPPGCTIPMAHSLLSTNPTPAPAAPPRMTKPSHGVVSGVRTSSAQESGPQERDAAPLAAKGPRRRKVSIEAVETPHNAEAARRALEAAVSGTYSAPGARAAAPKASGISAPKKTGSLLSSLLSKAKTASASRPATTVDIEARRKDRELKAVHEQGRLIRANISNECKKLLASDSESYFRCDPADQFTRFLTKDVAESNGLRSISAGEGDDRYVVIYKADGEPPPELVDAEREIEEAEEAAVTARARSQRDMRAAAAEVKRMREDAGKHGHVVKATGASSAARAAAEIAMRAVGAEALHSTEVIEKRTVGQIQDDTLAKRHKMH